MENEMNKFELIKNFEYFVSFDSRSHIYCVVPTRDFESALEGFHCVDEKIRLIVDGDGLHVGDAIIPLLDDYIEGEIKVTYGLLTEFKQYKSDFIRLSTTNKLLSVIGFILHVNEQPAEKSSIVSNTKSTDYLEMKAEALKRMLSIGMNEYVIADFKSTGEPMVYEPPMGAAYYMEKAELEYVRNLERTHKILIWGVIRCPMDFNGRQENVDCYLYVSNHHGWIRERKMLLEGTPHVFTYMKSNDLKDAGTINIEMSLGGTPKRVFKNFFIFL